MQHSGIDKKRRGAAEGDRPRAANKKAPPKGCPHKKGGNQILKIDRVGGESNPTESSTLVGQSTA